MRQKGTGVLHTVIVIVIGGLKSMGLTNHWKVDVGTIKINIVWIPTTTDYWYSEVPILFQSPYLN